jgi:predicted amidohydrolase YtcJ
MSQALRHAGTSFTLLMASLSLYAQVTVPEGMVMYADLIVYNGKIVTMSDGSLNNSTGRTAEALAIREDRIQAVGNDQEVLRYAGPRTRKVDLKGRTVVPGLIDTHNHLHNGATTEYFNKHPEKLAPLIKQFTVSGNTFEEVTKGIELIVKEHMANAQPGQWAAIGLPRPQIGSGIGPKYLRDNGMSGTQFDALAPNLPAVLFSGGGGFQVNSAGRKDLHGMLMGDPQNIDAFLDTWDLRGPGTAPAIGRAIVTMKYFTDRKGGLAELADILEDHLGGTPIAGGFTTYASHIQGLVYQPAFQKLVRENRMPIRFAFTFMGCMEFNRDMAGCFKRHGDWTGMGGKYFWNIGATLSAIDGGPPGNCTIAKPRPGFENVPVDGCMAKPGSVYYDAIYTMLRSRIRYVVNHNNGDLGLDTVLDIMDRVVAENPDITEDDMRQLRVTSDHCFMKPRPDQFPRLKKYGMIISCGFNLERIVPWIQVYGEQVAEWNQPAGGLIKAGVMATLEQEGRGDLAPFFPNYKLITRKTETGKIIGPNNAVDRATAMKMLTTWAASYVLKENELGSLEPGKYADLVVLNKDYFTVPENDIPTVFPLMTVLGGKTVMLRAELAKELGVTSVGPQQTWKFKPDYDPMWETTLPQASREEQ